MSTTKRRALILISSARQLPLAKPAEVASISTGFFLVEMAQVLKEFAWASSSGAGLSWSRAMRASMRSWALLISP